jgi:signal transduction histidine kinase
MRIQARLFLGTAVLVLALMGIQWWLHVRQLGAIQRNLGDVASTVGAEMLALSPRIHRITTPHFDKLDIAGLAEAALKQQQDSLAVGDEPDTKSGSDEESSHMHLRRMVGADQDKPEIITAKRIVKQTDSGTYVIDIKLGEMDIEKLDSTTLGWQEKSEVDDDVVTHTIKVNGVDKIDAKVFAGFTTDPIKGEVEGDIHHFKVGVVGGSERHENYLVVRSEAKDVEERISIPVSPTVEVVQSTMRRGIGFSAALLVVGLVFSGLFSRRLARPLQDLADRAEALGRGDLGVQVPETASGEVGELQLAFNRMSQRLAELEEEKEQWRQREHLAQLGDLARGLAHTVRNPLNTLGLTVEELANDEDDDAAGRDSQQLVITARAQIRRIDRWLRSFLAIGAGDAAEPEVTELGVLVQTVVLEAIQQGAQVELEWGDEDICQMQVEVVPTAMRAALANLLENAVEASPEGETVKVMVTTTDALAQVMVRDHGTGLPDEVRQRLFSPHVTTKVGGSGMGLFLARQLVVNMHGGMLDVADADGGGTVASVHLPLLLPGPEVCAEDAEERQ